MAGKGAKSQSRGRSSSADASPENTGVPPTRSTGPETATGQQIKWAAGEVEVPKGAERGSQVEIAGGDPKPTIEGGDEPRGLQAEDALFTSNGQVASDMEASPTGLQPIGANSATPEEAQKKIDQRKADHQAYIERSPKLERLDEPTIGRLGKTELRAIGLQRGYDMPETGTRAMRAGFIAAQDKDDRIGGSVLKGQGGSKGSQQAPGAKDGGNASLDRATRAAAPKGQGSKGGRKAGSARKGGRK
jgi:hypothetical protein